MAVTRINNNQITTAVSGNAYLGINAAAKLQNYSITSNKIANSLVYGSDLTISGNLVVNGTTTTIDTVNTLIQDPLITLADGQTAGTPTVDIGVIGLRGNQLSSFIGWKETANSFVAALSNTTVSNTTANITAYADFGANNIIANGNLSVIGNISGSANFTGNLTAGNILTPGLVSATGTITSAANIDGANFLTTGLISATGNLTSGNVLTAGLISATGNLTSGNVLTAGLISATGNITSASTVNTANISLSGNVISELNVTGNIAGANLLTPGLISSTGNITSGNVLTAGVVSATANITGGNILTAGLISAGGNITSATNVNTPSVVGASGLSITTDSGDITINPAGNIDASSSYINNVNQPVQSNDVATKIYVDNMVSTQIAYHQAVVVATTTDLATTTGGTISYTQPNGAGNGVGALLTTTGSFNIIDTSNVQTLGTRILVKNEANATYNGVYTWANATNIVRSLDADVYGPNSSEELSINDYFFVQSGNVNKGSAWVVDAPAGVITFGTSNISFAQFSSSQTYTAGNGISLYGTVISTVYDNATIGVNGSNQLYIPANAPLVTPNIGAATGTSLSVTGNIDAGTTISAAGNINTSANINLSGTGNINGYNGYFSNSVTVVANLYTSGNVVATQAGVFYGNSVTGNGAIYAGLPGYTILGSNVVAQFTGNVNSYSQMNFQNINNGTQASTDFILTNDAGNDTVGFMDMGIASSNWDGTQTNSLGGAVKANDGYLYTDAGNTVIGTTDANTYLRFSVGGSHLSNVYVANISNVGIEVTGFVSATGNITSPNVVGTTSGTFGNIVISGDNITDTNGRVNVNDALGDVDFAVNGAVANIFYVDAGTNTASFGNSTQTTNAIVAFNADTSILLPVGNTGVRPSNASSTTGMFRFNTTLNTCEVFDNSQWVQVGGTVFTVVGDEQFNGDGTTVNFTLGSTQTTNSCIVSINGIVQVPASAYSVSGTFPSCVLTFTEAPSVGDLIDVREITTTTTVTSISNASGNSVLTGSATRAEMTLTGNLIPIGANATQTLGNATNAWSSLYVAGNTIYLGNIQLQQGAANSFVVYQSDGVTPATFGGAGGISITGNVVGGNIVGTLVGDVSTNSITNSGANATGNIGNSTSWFNTIFAKAQNALYADLAEKYEADTDYAPGTVVSFGGKKEVTKSTVDGDRAVAGVVSTNPSYIMNAGLDAEHVAVVAFTGRVPTSVTGTVSKGDLMVSNGDGTARAEADPKVGSIIGKALENFAGNTGVIEVVIGRF